MTLRALQIFAAGTHTPMEGGSITFNQDDLQQIALGYDPQRKPAKLVLGHPSAETVDFGSVRHLAAVGDSLFALAEVKDQLIQMVRRGLYRAVSASLLPPNHKDNPSPRAWYLRHVGFLGAQAPSVKNMQPISFSEPEQTLHAVNFAAPIGYSVDAGRLRLYHAALDIQSVMPNMTFMAAASLAERALVR